jgi:hypothetical protein
MEKAVDVFKVLVTKGVVGLWDMIQEKLTSLWDTILDQIKDFVITRIITAGITWIISLLNPASAFIKACKAIYDIVMWIVERGQQLLEFVDSIISSIGAIAKGNLGEVASKVEDSLAKALPVAISFLASLLGLGGISEKIKSVIETVRKPINAAVDWVVGKAVSGAKKLFGGAARYVKGKYEKGKKYVKGKIEAGKKYVKGKIEAGKKYIKGKASAAKKKIMEALGLVEKQESFEDDSGNAHTLTMQADADAETVELSMASEMPGRLRPKLAAARKAIEAWPNATRVIKGKTYKQAQLLGLLSGAEAAADEKSLKSALKAVTNKIRGRDQGYKTKLLNQFRESTEKTLKSAIDKLRGIPSFDSLNDKPFDKRWLPKDFDIRERLYLRSGWGTKRNEIIQRDLGERVSMIYAVDGQPGSAKEKKGLADLAQDWQDPNKAWIPPSGWAGFKKPDKIADQGKDRFVTYLSEIEYDVDHDPPLAVHWNAGGNDQGDKGRENAAFDDSHLEAMFSGSNRSKGSATATSGKVAYNRWVGKGFFSDMAEGGLKTARTIEGQWMYEDAGLTKSFENE